MDTEEERPVTPRRKLILPRSHSTPVGQQSQTNLNKRIFPATDENSDKRDFEGPSIVQSVKMFMQNTTPKQKRLPLSLVNSGFRNVKSGSLDSPVDEYAKHSKSLPPNFSPKRTVGRSLTQMTSSPSNVRKRINLAEPKSKTGKTEQSDVSGRDEDRTKRGSCFCKCLRFVVILCMVLTGFVLLLTGVHHHTKPIKKYICDHNTRFNLTNLNDIMQRHFYGQHIAVDIVNGLLQKFLSQKAEISTPLVLSFHGWTGVGKNHLSGIIAEEISIKSKSIHKFIAPYHFPHKELNDEYRENLRSWILRNISSCAVNLFILDEIDKAPPGVIKGFELALVELVKNKSSLFADSKVIFILISNTHGADINRYVLQQIITGHPRKMLDMNSLSHIFGHGESLWYRSLHRQGFINAFIPFLPLERLHVEMCIRREINQRGLQMSDKTVSTLADQISYFPKHVPIFSKSGCRKVASKVDLSLD